MNEREIYIKGVRAILAELEKKLQSSGTYAAGIVEGIEIGMKLNEEYESMNCEDQEDGTKDEKIRKSKIHRTRRVYTEEIKRKAVSEFFNNGLDFKKVMKEYDILSQCTIVKWAEELADEFGKRDVMNEFLQGYKRNN